MEQKLRRDKFMGENLRRLRIESGLSQENYAQNCKDILAISDELRMQNMNLES